MTLSHTAATPGRPREFEIDDAVESAMQVFWTRGYNGTSLVDLIDGTGLSRGSLYKAFGDKHTLFQAALARYVEGSSAGLFHTLQKQAPAKVLVRETLVRFVQLSCAEEGLRGCMLIAAATELAPQDAGVAQSVQALFDRMRNAYATVIERGQAQGEIPAHHDAQTLARLIVCLTQGMRVVGKTGATEQQMTAVADAAMSLLD